MKNHRLVAAFASIGLALIVFVVDASPAFAARTVTAATFNGAASITVSTGANIPLSITIQTTGSGNPASWQSTGWQIATAKGAFTCINTPPHLSKASVYTATSTIVAPSVAGVYNAYFIAYSGTNCTDLGNTNPSAVLTLKKAVTVTSNTPPPPPPTVTITPATLPNGTVSSTYTQTLTASTTATGNFTWSLAAGSLPAGLQLGATTGKMDVISGTPTAVATSTFTVKATNGTSSSTANYIINIAPIVITTSTPTSTNLIVDPLLNNDTITPGIPDGWNQGGWGTNAAAFNYPVAGVNGGTGANVTISSYTDGDAKWYFNNVLVTPGSNYTFSDSYNSNVASALVVQFTAAGGALSYDQIATLPSTNGTWATTSQTITIPANVAAVTVFHLISSVGSLTTTNYSLAPSTGNSNLFPEGLVSLTFDDGWQSQYDNALPILQAANMHGTFYIISDGMLNAIETTFPSTANPFNVATTTMTTTWPQIYTDPTQHTFVFSDIYTATGPSTITVKYNVSGTGASSTVLGTLPAGTNASANFSFTLPVLSGPLTIMQAVTGSDTLTATNPLLQQPIGYMDTNHVLAMQADGEEIGDHTVNHCDLVAIQNDPTNTASCAVFPPPTTTVSQQVDNGRTALQNAGLSPVDTFAYPYGSGAGNSTVEGIVAADGIVAARSVNSGYNTKTTDHYALLNQAIDQTVTDPATVQQWIDYAAANHVWLILTFHQVELSSSTITKNKETDATTAAMLQSIVSYLKQQQVAGKIDVDTVHNIMAQFMN